MLKLLWEFINQTGFAVQFGCAPLDPGKKKDRGIGLLIILLSVDG
jgi:hypothetical protein